MDMTKKCSRCKKSKNVIDFHKNSSKPDGRTNECKECRKVYYKVPEKDRVYRKGVHHSPATEFKKGHNRTPRGKDSPAWKGGKYLSNGYVFVLKRGHPAANKDHHVPEHRLVMEDILGRCLEPHEHVHHNNSIRNDNRPENLTLFVRGKNWHIKKCPQCGFHFGIK